MTKQYRVAFDLLAKPFRVAAISNDTLLQDRDGAETGRPADSVMVTTGAARLRAWASVERERHSDNAPKLAARKP